MLLPLSLTSVVGKFDSVARITVHKVLSVAVHHRKLNFSWY